MTKASDNAYPSLLITEGTVPASPAAGKQRLYIDSTAHAPKLVNSSGVASFLPGYEIDYVEITSPVNITGTTEAGATTIVTGSAVSYDGNSKVLIEFVSPSATSPSNAAGDYNQIVLFDNGSVIGTIGIVMTDATGRSANASIYCAKRITPSNASHTYSIRAYVPNTTGTPRINAGSGGAGTYYPSYIRITKI